MGDPQRLLSNLSDAEDLERELLGSIQRADPPADAKGEAWARLSAQIGAVALVSSAHGSAAASSAASTGSAAVPGGASSLGLASSSALKVLGGKLVVGLAVAGAALGASVWVHGRVSQPRTAPPAAATPIAGRTLSPPPTPTAPELTEGEPPSAPKELSPTPEIPAKANVDQRRRDRLSAESALLTRARAELRRGDAAAAQQTLNQLRAHFPKGVLGQEREVLAIEVLSARGHAEAAQRRAKAFIAAYPKSPHSAQLSRFADAP